MTPAVEPMRKMLVEVCHAVRRLQYTLLARPEDHLSQVNLDRYQDVVKAISAVQARYLDALNELEISHGLPLTSKWEMGAVHRDLALLKVSGALREAGLSARSSDNDVALVLVWCDV